MTGESEIYKRVFNASEDAIFLYDVTKNGTELEFELRDLNPAHEATTGLSAEEHRGATPREILGDTQGAEATANLRRCVERQETISYDQVFNLPTGTIHWRAKLSPIVRDDEVVQIVGIARDITEQKEREETLRKTRERLKVALEATNTGVWEWNLETDEVVWNEALERLVGIEPGTFGGTYEAFLEFLHPEEGEKIEEAVAKALEGSGTFEAEFRMVREDGDTIWVLGRGELFTEGGPRRMVGTTTDITEHKENELELARREILDLSVELELHTEAVAELLFDQFGQNVQLSSDGIVPGPDDTWLFYVTTNVTPEGVRKASDMLPVIEDARLLSTSGETFRYELAVGSDSAVTIFNKFEGDLRSIELEEGVCKLVGVFPETVDPVAVTEAVRGTYPDVELAAQRRIVSPAYLRSILEDILTERQYSVLGMAYYSGYFEQPRNVTGDELATRLGITRQTFNTHLRKAQARLLRELFEGQIDSPG